MTDTEIQDLLAKEGYSFIRKLPDGRWIGIMPMLFTIGLFVGLDEYGYSYRYCYPLDGDWKHDVQTWDGTNDPKGNWIKRKGLGEDKENELI